MFLIGPDNKIPKITAVKMQMHPDLRKTQYWGHLVPDGDIWRAKGVHKIKYF